MNEVQFTSSPSSGSPAASWQQPVVNPDRTGEAAEHERRRVELATQVLAVARKYGWKKAEVARRIDMAEGTFHQWYAGTYGGRLDFQNKKVAQWLGAVDEMEQQASGIPTSPLFVATEFAGQVEQMLRVAQVMPTMVMVSAEAGMGKTFAARRYRDSGQNVFLATISPHTRSVYNMLHEIAASLDVRQAQQSRLARAIGERLARRGAGTLLIVDECQHLTDDAVNQLRHFVDNYGCGIALLGNTEIYNRYAHWASSGGYGQLRSRIFKRLSWPVATPGDVDAFVAAWRIKEADQKKFLRGVGLKPGGLRQVDMTCKLATLMAIGEGRELTVDDLKKAWSNRDVGAGA